MRIARGIFFIFFIACITANVLFAAEPIEPLPKTVEYDKPRADIGKLLFFDKEFSNDRVVSCASCHDPYSGGGYDGKTFLGEHRKKRIKDATVLNVVFNFRQFWNGRAKDLKEHAVMTMKIPISMNITKEEIEQRLNSSESYRKLFRAVFKKERLVFDDFIDALVEFEKALITPDCKFDRYLRGEVLLSAEEQNGYDLFKKLGCVTCHNGVNIGGNSFQKIGVINPYPWKEGVNDLFKLTKDPFDKNRFKVPSLRNIELRAPYFHDKSAAKLEAAVKKMAFHNLGYAVSDVEVKRLTAFLKTLTGRRPAILE